VALDTLYRALLQKKRQRQFWLNMKYGHLGIAKYATVLAAIISCSFLSCDTSKNIEPQPSISEMTLLQTHQAWSTAVREGDATKILSYWDENAADYFPGKPVAHGKKAINKSVKQNLSRPGFALTSVVEGAHVADSGEMGYTTGAFTMIRDDISGNPVTEYGNFMCIWKKTSGVWRCIQSMSTLENKKNFIQ
jgi:ketosteroid isomerase-like protein